MLPPIGDNEIIELSERWIARYRVVGRYDTQTQAENIRDEAYWIVWYARAREKGKDHERAMQDMENSMAAEAGQPPPFPSETPIPSGDLTAWPRRGATIAASLIDTRWDIERWATILGDRFGGRGITQVNVLSAPWPEMAPYMELPFVREADGRWNLRKPNPKFYDRLPRLVEAHNRRGTLVLLCFLELYSWSFRKTGLPFDQDQTWARHNVNGVRWGGPSREEDDATLISLPDAFLVELVERVVGAVRGAGCAVVPFNEGPEKAVHEKIAAIVKRIDPSMRVVTNRNEDTPGQYMNMRVGTSAIDMIAFHGWADLGFLDIDHPDEPLDRPRTFRQFFDKQSSDGRALDIDFSRIICSSDGSRASSDPVNTYDKPRLLEVFRFIAGKRGSIEHQERAKMSPGANLGMVDLPFLDEIAGL